MSTEIIAVLAITWFSLCVVLICAYAVYSDNKNLKRGVNSWRERTMELHDHNAKLSGECLALTSANEGLRKSLNQANDALRLTYGRPMYTITARVQPHHDATGKTTSLTLDLVITRDGVTKFVEVRRLAASKKSRDELTAVAAKINLAAKEMSA